MLEIEKVLFKNSKSKERFHQLLERQLQRRGLDMSSVDKAFLEDISVSYEQWDRDLAILERSVDLSVAEYKQAAASMTALLQALPDQIVKIRADGVITFCSGESSGDAIINLVSSDNFYKALPEPQVAPIQKAVQRCIDSNRIQERELSINDGRITYLFEVRLIPTYGEQVIVLLRDVTVQRRNEQELNRVCEDLIRSNQELDDFAYIASHDLKEPLRGISNYSSFLLEDYNDKIDEGGTEKLKTLIDLSKRMEQLIDTLLDYSRVGRVDLAYGEINLQESVENVLQTLQFTIQEKEIEIRIPKDLPIVECDGARIAEVFRNLITNAMKYNDKEQKWVEVSFDIDPDSSIPTFYVRDNGIGIKENKFSTVFKIFKRLHSRNKYEGGTGAGLTIVKRIVERHGGKIWIESELGKGTAFFFTLQEGLHDGW